MPLFWGFPPLFAKYEIKLNESNFNNSTHMLNSFGYKPRFDKSL